MYKIVISFKGDNGSDPSEDTYDILGGAVFAFRRAMAMLAELTIRDVSRLHHVRVWNTLTGANVAYIPAPSLHLN